ncbi:MAG: trehalose-phosphatase [Micropruina sp.]|nr:trehalose-phosphatase [Micropruina sp.]
MSSLEALAATPRLLVALDVDGTLAPLSDRPMEVRLTPGARAAVLRLAGLPDTTVALVSGRTLEHLRFISEHSDDWPILLAGSHGAEYWLPGEGELARADDPAEVALRDDLQAQAQALVETLDGVWIEPKTFGLAVHTRLASPADGDRAARLVDDLMATRASGWRRRTGHNVVEYAFRSEGKDSAVRVLRQRVQATAVLFAGDDLTDEDALASLGPSDLGVLVGDRDTHASVRVADIDAMAALLARLAELRASTQRG